MSNVLAFRPFTAASRARHVAQLTTVRAQRHGLAESQLQCLLALADQAMQRGSSPARAASEAYARIRAETAR